MFVVMDFEVHVLFDSTAMDINTEPNGPGSLSEEAAEMFTDEIGGVKELVTMELQALSIAHPAIEGISVEYVEV